MQTFLPYPNIIQSAQCLDNKRLGKQRVEALQILKAINQGLEIAFIWDWDDNGKEYKKLLWFKSLDSGDGTIKTPWFNHPCTKMWKGYESCLVLYYNVCINEWIYRGFKNTLLLIAHSIPIEHKYWAQFVKWPKWFGNKDFHDSHKSNLLRKMPEHYSKFGWQVSNNLPYIWPEN